MLSAHMVSAPSSKYISTEEIEVKTLNCLLPNIDTADGSVWLKIDTQGFEAEVLTEASDVLDRIETIQLVGDVLATSLCRRPTFHLLMKWMNDHGYELVGLQPGFTDTISGRLLQVEGIFRKSFN